MKRRRALTLIGGGMVGTSGCLRLTSGGPGDRPTSEMSSTPSPTPSDGTPSPTSSDGTPTSDGAGDVTLTESWTDESGVDNIWTREGTFYYNDYNYAAEASHGDGVRWSAEATYDGVERNFGADAFAADGRYAVFGYTPEVEDDEERGAHFHAHRRYDGEEVWTVGAPPDGTHKLAAGATVVGDLAVLAVSDYGGGNTGTPAVYGADIETGELRWQVDQSVLSAALVRDVVGYDGDVYVATTEGVKTLAGETGDLIRSQDQWHVGTYRLESLGRGHGETLFAGWGRTFVSAYPLGENGVSWSRSEVGPLSTNPAVDNSLVVVGTQEGDVYALERGSGETRWEASITNAVGALETTGSHAWVGDTEIGLTAYDRETGSLAHRSAKPVNGDDIAVADDVLLLGGDTATAYMVD